MAEEVILLDYWPSPFGTRARIVLAEKGISYIHKFEDLPNKSPLLLKMNPVHQKVPVLVHKDKPVCESDTIIQYIDEVWNQSIPLLPSEPHQRYMARFLVDFINKKVRTSYNFNFTLVNFLEYFYLYFVLLLSFILSGVIYWLLLLLLFLSIFWFL